MSEITHEELAKHNKEDNLWVCIHGKVYDVSKFKDHPGSYQSLLLVGGRDATQDFEDQGHGNGARKKLEQYYVGELVGAEDGEVKAQSGGDSKQTLVIIAVIAALCAVYYKYFYI